MSSVAIGEELIRRGWTQGSLVDMAVCPEASLSWDKPARNDARPAAGQQPSPHAEGGQAPTGWEISLTPVRAHDYLVITSHPCDIKKPDDKEPYVEAIPAYWTSDKQVIHNARNNAIRFRLLRSRQNAKGQEEGLIADAAHKVLLRKATLLGLTPQEGIDQEDTLQVRSFGNWLANRYVRPVLPDPMVLAIQRPLVDALRKLPPRDRKKRALDGIREILFWPQTEAPPFEIEMWFLLDESQGAPVTDRAAATELAGWIGNVMAKTGACRIVHWDLVSLDDVSLKSYMTARKLPLDDYSPPMETVLSAPSQTLVNRGESSEQ